MDKLSDLVDSLPDDLARESLTHSSWVPHRVESYERLAFLGDSVLALSITAYLYPRLEAATFGAGKLTKIRAQVVSGHSCRTVAERLKVPGRLRQYAPVGSEQVTDALTQTERVLASVTER